MGICGSWMSANRVEVLCTASRETGTENSMCSTTEPPTTTGHRSAIIEKMGSSTLNVPDDVDNDYMSATPRRRRLWTCENDSGNSETTSSCDSSPAVGPRCGTVRNQLPGNKVIFVGTAKSTSDPDETERSCVQQTSYWWSDTSHVLQNMRSTAKSRISNSKSKYSTGTERKNETSSSTKDPPPSSVSRLALLHEKSMTASWMRVCPAEQIHTSDQLVPNGGETLQLMTPHEDSQYYSLQSATAPLLSADNSSLSSWTSSPSSSMLLEDIDSLYGSMVDLRRKNPVTMVRPKAAVPGRRAQPVRVGV